MSDFKFSTTEILHTLPCQTIRIVTDVGTQLYQIVWRKNYFFRQAEDVGPCLLAHRKYVKQRNKYMQSLNMPRGKCLIWHFSILYFLIRFAPCGRLVSD